MYVFWKLHAASNLKCLVYLPQLLLALNYIPVCVSFFGPETLFLRIFSAVMGFPSKSIIISRRGASQDPICSVDVIFFVSGVITMFYSLLIDQEEMKALR